MKCWRSGSPRIIHWHRDFQERSSRSGSGGTDPALEIHGGNRLPISGAGAVSRETLRTGTHATGGGIDCRRADVPLQEIAEATTETAENFSGLIANENQ